MPTTTPHQTERFHLGAVLSMTTGKLLCPMDDIGKLAEHLVGKPVWTHQLPQVRREATPHLLAQFPFLAPVTGDEVTPENFAAWLDERACELGEWFDVAPMPDAHVAAVSTRAQMCAELNHSGDNLLIIANGVTNQ